MIKRKRVYEPPASADGARVLVDRLWPRGLSKDKAKIGFWMKDVAPSHALRKWFGHDPARWPLFKEKYAKELLENERAVQELRGLEKSEGAVTLLFGAKDARRNNAAALIGFLMDERRKKWTQQRKPSPTRLTR